MLDRACEVYGKPVPLRVLRDADEGDICKSCQEMFFEDRIEEDKCPVCGAEGFMCSGILVNSGLQEEFIVFP